MRNELSILAAVAALVTVAAQPALAGPKCAGSGEKLSEAKVQEMYKAQGYEIVRWKVDGGGCYEIYGKFSGKKVETYIDPWTGNKVKEEIAG
jgi:hypothetical protein